MSTAATLAAEATETVPPMAEPPPITLLLPLLQQAFSGLSLFFRLGIRLVLAAVYPLHIIWSILFVLFSPVLVVLKVTLDIVVLTPLSIIRTVAVALYPVYVFFAVACIFGATVGMFGHYVSTTILNVLARSKYFTRPPTPPPATRPSTPQSAMLRKRKRKSVRLQ